jgi:tryptophanyl-tRNA synthetase
MPEVSIVPGTDGQKMSKSYGNVIPLFATDAEIKKAVAGIVTDSARPEDKKNPDNNNIYKIHKLFITKKKIKLFILNIKKTVFHIKKQKIYLTTKFFSVKI